MAITATPSTVTVFPAASSNPGNPSVNVALAGDSSYSVSNPSPSIVSASITGSTLAVGYIAPLTTAGVPVTLTVTGSPSGATTNVTVYSYGPLILASSTPIGSPTASFTVTESGYAGTLSASVSPANGTVTPSSSAGPSWGPQLVLPASPGNCTVTITDDHGGSVSFPTAFYTGANYPQRPAPLGYPTAGVWFDFLHPDAEGLPTVGEIRGMPVTGVAQLQGPQDDGNFVWCSGIADAISEFDQGFGDNGQPITVTWAGKSDFFDEELGKSAALRIKTVDNVALMVSIPVLYEDQTLTFSAVVTADQYTALQTLGESSIVEYSNTGNQVGSAVVGSAVVGQSPAAESFQITRAFSQLGARGRVIAIGFQETSVYDWTVLGYVVRASTQEETVP